MSAYTNPGSNWLRWMMKPGLYLLFFSLAIQAMHAQNVGNSDSNNKIIWQLNLNKNHGGDYQLQFAKITKDDKGGPCIEADSRQDNSSWHYAAKRLVQSRRALCCFDRL